MYRILTIVALLPMIAFGAGERPAAGSDTEKRILNTIDGIERGGARYANVPSSDGRMLRLLAEAVNARSVVEIGTSTGISGLWFCLALEKTGGRLTTFELDPGRAAAARAHFKKAGVERLVTLVEGDAHRAISSLKDPIDVVFIDAEKQGYPDYLKQLLPLVRRGGLVLAHNVDMVPEYMKLVTTDPSLETVVYMQGGGLALTLKKR
ncbi:MAG TPA: class I SAM-dependent methyltransferase [Bryobacteraceae bacterium]|nr:class I SAM-dependent methyltransferase [Bryobacteraceae bacterium]